MHLMVSSMLETRYLLAYMYMHIQARVAGIICSRAEILFPYLSFSFPGSFPVKIP